jgi:hypothetical protein
MWETILVAIIVVFAAVWVTWRLWRTAGGRDGGCGCGSSCGCSGGNPCNEQSKQDPASIFNIIEKGNNDVAET